ncbi:MAG: hypothetical protein FJ308_19395, partial [Planctomycetes bacterium]|nr:hypothetical protein [Planctomycetota bacterium]
MKLTYASVASLLLIGLYSLDAISQTAPYDVYPEANAPYFRIRWEPSKEVGGLIFGVNFTLWIPPDTPQVRG